MAGQDLQIKSSEGAFDCYIADPELNEAAPCIVMAPSVFGVNDDLRGICDFFSSHGFIAAAPDIFWRVDKGPLTRAERSRALARASDRSAVFRSARADFKTTLDYLRSYRGCSGKSAILGFCFGGPFAVIGITELGCDAGASYHGSNFDEQVGNLKHVDRPLQLHWGDNDFALSPELLERARSACSASTEIFVYPGVKHGYTGPESPDFDARATEKSWQRSLSMLKALTT